MNDLPSRLRWRKLALILAVENRSQSLEVVVGVIFDIAAMAQNIFLARPYDTTLRTLIERSHRT